MAFTRSNLGTASSAGPAASIAVASATAAIGDLVVVGVAAANSGTSGVAVTTTCADAAGNTYTQRSQVNHTAGVADDGITLTVFTSLISSTLTASAVTVSFSPSSAQGCVMTVRRYRPASGETASFIAAGAGATGNSAAPSITASSVDFLDTIVGCIAEEAATTITADTDTTDGTWSTKYEVSIGSGDPAAHVVTQDKDATATGAQTFNVTTSVAHDFAINYIIIRSAGPKKVTAVAGSYAVTGQAATLTIFPYKLPVDAGAYVVTGAAASLIKTTTVVPVIASYAVTGTAATLSVATLEATLSAAAGSYEVSGATASLERSSEVVADAGSYAITGVAASLERGWQVAANAGSYAVTGTAASLEVEGARLLSAESGFYSVIGQSTTSLVYSGDPGGPGNASEWIIRYRRRGRR